MKRDHKISTRPALGGTWVQTQRAAHELWGAMATEHPRAAAVMHLIVAQMGPDNALVVTQEDLAAIARCSVRTLQRAVELLRDYRWLDVRPMGKTGTVNAYIVNDKVAWGQPREGLRYSRFSATVLMSSKHQRDFDPVTGEVLSDEPLRRLPRMYDDERQLPAGDGLPPPSEPALPGMEPDLPALHEAERGGEPRAIGDLLASHSLTGKLTPS